MPRELPPYVVRRNGQVVHRKGGHVIGTVEPAAFGGWVGETLISRTGPRHSRRLAAREVWKQHEKEVS